MISKTCRKRRQAVTWRTNNSAKNLNVSHFFCSGEGYLIVCRGMKLEKPGNTNGGTILPTKTNPFVMRKIPLNYLHICVTFDVGSHLYQIQGAWRHSAASYAALHPIEVLELQILAPRHGVPLTGRVQLHQQRSGNHFLEEMKVDANIWGFPKVVVPNNPGFSY